MAGLEWRGQGGYHSRCLPIGYVAEDRRSVYWDNGFSPKDYTRITPFVVTKRLNELVIPKRIHPDYQPPRTAVWKTPPSALTAMPTERILKLALPKMGHPNYRPSKTGTELERVHLSALTYQPTPRMYQLARHKVHVLPNIKFEDSDWQGVGQRKPVAHRIPQASDRVVILSEPKLTHPHYQPPRLDFSVSKEALNCIATERINQLARVKNRHPEAEDYNPNTFTVSRSALLAQASPRIEELSTPLPRKVKAKK